MKPGNWLFNKDQRMKKPVVLFIASFVIAMALQSCAEDEATAPEITFDSTPYTLDYKQFPPPQINPDNTLTVQGVKLGRMLFYEKRLSKDGTQSCASCHRQEHAFTDTATFSTGVKGLPGKRQAMAIFNMAWNTNEFFWDGRAHLLRDQSLMPIQDPLEMNESLQNVITKLGADQQYRDQFVRAFGSDEITAERMSLAMEQFMNTLLSVNSKYDRSLDGQATLTPSEERGRKLYFAEFNPGFPHFPGLIVPIAMAEETLPLTAISIMGWIITGTLRTLAAKQVTQNPNDKGKFKVVSLRNVEVTPPYIHDGRFKTLEEVVEHYDNGIHNSATVDPALEYTRAFGWT